MAACAKCGAALPSDGPGFCPACGAPVSVAPTAQPIAVPAAAVPPPGYAGAPPTSSGGGALKVVLIVIAVVVGLGVIGVGVGGYFVYRAAHNAGASFSAGNGAQVSTDDLGTDPYPGATHVDQGSMRMKFGGNSVVTSAFTTSDSAADVVKFYQDKLGASAEVNETGRGTTLERATHDGGNEDSLVITVAPAEQDGQTKIVIVHTQAVHQ